MPGTNDFLPFAVGGGANVLTQAQYAALTTLLANGYQSGTAQSIQINKTFRQSSIMAAVLGTLIADVTNQNVVDDGTTATILSNLMAALNVAGYVVDTGAVNAYVATLSPAILAYYDGLRIGFKTANANTTTNPTVNVNGLGAVTITAPGGGALLPGQIPASTNIRLAYNSTGPRFELESGAPGVTVLGGTMTGTLKSKVITETGSTPAIAAGSLTLDLSAGSVFDVALNGNITTFTWNNPPTTGTFLGFSLIFTADGTARSVTWPASVKWPGGTAPTLTSTLNKQDIFTFITRDGGTSYLGFVSGQNL